MTKQVLAARLRERGWDYRTLAKYFKVSRQTIWNWVNKRS